MSETIVTIVSDIAAFYALNTGADLVYLEGYNSFADGGEGFFILGPNAANNGGTIITTTNGPYTYYRETDAGALNVRWFGATLTQSDSTSAIQTCLNVAAAMGTGAAVYFPAGTYAISEVLTYNFAAAGDIGLAIYGDGPDVTQLVWPNSDGLYIQYHDITSSITLRGLSFVTGSGGSHTALSLSNPTGGANDGGGATNLIENVTFHGSDGYGQTAYWASCVVMSLISDVNFYSCNFDQREASGTFGVYVQGTASDNLAVIFNFTNCGFKGGNYSIFYGAYAQGLTISGCNFVGSNYGVYCNSGEDGLVQLGVTNSQFNCLLSNIELNTIVGDVFLSGNLFYINTGGGTGQVAVNLGNINNFTVIGNQFIGNNAGDTGLLVSEIAGQIGGTVIGNTFSNYGSQAVYLGEGTKNINVLANSYAGNAATVTNLPGNINNVGNPTQ